MELIVSLSDIGNLEKLANSAVSGIMIGSDFSLNYSYSREILEDIVDYCETKNIKKYVVIDALISESNIEALRDYLIFLRKLTIDGIYFTDLGVINVAKRLGLTKKLIFDGDTLITNSLDAAFFVKQGIGVVAARELSYEELKKVVERNPQEVDIQIFGHIKLSNSKRKILSNYFNYIGTNYDIKDKRSLSLVEENRNYHLPIIEDDYGSRIYSDYCLLMYKELAYLSPYVKRAIVDDMFIRSEVLFDVVRDIRKLTVENANFLRDTLINKYQDMSFATGFLDTKSLTVKEENE